MPNKKIEGILANYQDEILDLGHAGHEFCGEIFCVDEGGAVINESDFKYFKNEIAEQYGDDNYKELKGEGQKSKWYAMN